MAHTLTLGIELEFIVATLPDTVATDKITSLSPPDDLLLDIIKADEALPDSQTKYLQDHGPCAELIANTLTEHGIPAYPRFRGKWYRFPTSEENLEGWEIKTDCGIRVVDGESTPCYPQRDKDPDGEPYHYVDIEVVSPKLRKGFSGNQAEDERAFDEVKEFINTIQSYFFAFCNTSTGLHIHVENDDLSFPIDTLQKLMAFLYTFDPSISSLHPPHRRLPKPTSSDDDAYSLGLRLTMDKKVKQLGGADIIHEIMKQPTLKDSGVLMLRDGSEFLEDDFGRNRAYNLRQLLTEGRLKTVEFRQHTGTLDGSKVVIWAKFCFELLDFARRTQWRNTKTYLQREIEKEETTGTVRSFADICHVIEFVEGQTEWRNFVSEADV